MKKLFLSIFILSLVVLPSTSNAGFFDFLKKDNQTAQVRSATTNVVGYKKGDRSDVILQVQQSLAKKGLYQGDLSGLIGPKTERAIMAYQKANGLSSTGILDVNTLNSILGRGNGNERGGGIQTTSASANCAPGDVPWIQVISPNGGETYLPGENVKVQWESCNLPAGSQVFIAFNAASLDLSGGYTMINSTLNDGVEQVTLESASEFGTQQGDWYYGLHYKIGVGLANPIGYDDYRDYSDNLFSIVDQLVGGGNCVEEDVELSILPTTPVGIQTNLNDFPVLSFKIENNSDCEVRLNGIRLAYMTTDVLPYFEDISLREKDTMVNVWASSQFDTDIGLTQGEFIDLSDDGTAYIIDSGDEQELIVVLEGYIPQTQGPLTYAEYSNKNMIFGFPRLNPLDTDFLSPEESFNITLPQDIWGEVVKLPLSAF